MRWEGDEWLVLTEDEDVGLAGDELVAFRVDELDHGVGTVVVVDLDDLAGTAAVLASSDGGKAVWLELGGLHDLSCLDVVLDSVAGHDGDVQEAEVVSVVSVTVEDTLLAGGDGVDLQELEVSLVLFDWYELEAALGVIHDAEVLVHLWNSEDVHEASWEAFVGTGLAVDDDVLVADDHACLAHVAGEVEAVADDQGEWEALVDAVWTLRRSWGVDATHLVEHPVGWSVQTFHMQTWTTSLLC